MTHDLGEPVAYSLPSGHLEKIRKMIILDTLLPGFGLEEAGNFLS